MLIRPRPEIPSSEITPESVYWNRRDFIRAAAAGTAALAATPIAGNALLRGDAPPARGAQQQTDELGDPVNSFEQITTYNNFYEFGLDKEDPARNSGAFRPLPWTVRVDGLVNNPGDFAFEDFLAPHTVEDRVYRLRCVEAWSMVIPWRGFPLAELVRRAEPTSAAAFVEFTTIVRPTEMVGQRSRTLEWPYIEGLRLDEAMHPLSFLVTGLYGQDLLPNQNGAPLRLVVPWKYGFKGIKSIVRIRFVEEMPVNTWWATNPSEYGFYANVNPRVDHPRWTQANERRIGEIRRRDTLMFNGYADQVAPLYSGMDLTRWI